MKSISTNQVSYLKNFLRLFAVVSGIIQGLASVYDSPIVCDYLVSYLDMADAYIRHDWKTAISGTLTPFYSWILALFTLILKPSPSWEYPCVVFVDIFVYIFTILCFDFFLHRVVSYQKTLYKDDHNTSWRKLCSSSRG